MMIFRKAKALKLITYLFKKEGSWRMNLGTASPFRWTKWPSSRAWRPFSCFSTRKMAFICFIKDFFLPFYTRNDLHTGHEGLFLPFYTRNGLHLGHEGLFPAFPHVKWPSSGAWRTFSCFSTREMAFIWGMKDFFLLFHTRNGLHLGHEGLFPAFPHAKRPSSRAWRPFSCLSTREMVFI